MDKVAPVLNVNVADVHAVCLELRMGGVDVGNDYLQARGSAGRRLGEALADADGAGGAGWG